MPALAVIAGCATPPQAVSHALGDPVHVVATAPPSCPVCSLYAVHRTNVVRLMTKNGQGAGVIVRGDGSILTSAHVVAGFDEVRVGTYDGHEYTGTVVYADADMDLAVVRVEPAGEAWPGVELEPDDSLPIGSKIFVIGHPVGLGWTVTQGIVSGRRRVGEAAPTALLQTDAAISPGNSGGPMLDEHGHLVAIVRSKLVGPGIENVSFGVPMSAVIEFLNRVPARAGVQAPTGAHADPTGVPPTRWSGGG